MEYQFQCLKCDALTPVGSTHDECRQQSIDAGWSWGKALLCPNCKPSPPPEVPTTDKEYP